MQYYELLKYYKGDLSKATKSEKSWAARGNPNDPQSALRLARKKYKEEQNKGKINITKYMNLLASLWQLNTHPDPCPKEYSKIVSQLNDERLELIKKGSTDEELRDLHKEFNLPRFIKGVHK